MSGNIKKRMVKAPKIYVRDSGLVHALLNLVGMEDLLAHPVAGPSWEGMVIENLIAAAGDTLAYFYRSAAGAEIDLVLEGSDQRRYAIEIKRSTSPTVGKGFWNGCSDLDVTEAIVVYPGDEVIPLGKGVHAMNVRDAMGWVSRHGGSRS